MASIHLYVKRVHWCANNKLTYEYQLEDKRLTGEWIAKIWNAQKFCIVLSKFKITLK